MNEYIHNLIKANNRTTADVFYHDTYIKINIFKQWMDKDNDMVYLTIFGCIEKTSFLTTSRGFEKILWNSTPNHKFVLQYVKTGISNYPRCFFRVHHSQDLK